MVRTIDRKMKRLRERGRKTKHEEEEKRIVKLTGLHASSVRLSGVPLPERLSKESK